MADRELVIKFVGKNQGLTETALAGGKAIDKLGDQALGAARQLETAGGSAKSFNSAIAGLAAGASFAALDLLVGALQSAGQAVLGFVANTLEVGGAAQKANVAFTTILGSAEAAQDLLGELSDFAATTPFDLPGVRQAGQQLLAFGFESDTIIPNLRALGDVAAGVNTDFGELANIYGKAKVAGRLYADDVNQLTERGIPIIQEFAEQFGVAESQVKLLVEQGKIGFPELEQAFINMTKEGSQFGGLMEAQSKIIPGLVANIKDSFTGLQESIFLAFAPANTALLTTFQATLDETGQNFDGFGPILEAGEQLNEVLSGSPEIAERIGEALGEFANVAVEQLAGLIDAVARFADDEANIERLAEGIESVARAIQVAGTVAGIIGDISFKLVALLETAKELPIIGGLIERLFVGPLGGIAQLGGAIDALGELRDRAGRLRDNLLGVRNEFEVLNGAKLGEGLNSAREALGTALAEYEESTKAPLGEAPKPKPPDLTAIEDKYKGLTATIDIEESKQIAALVRGGATQEAIAAKEQEFLQKRIDLNQKRATELRVVNASALDEKSQAKLKDDLLALDQSLADDRLKIAEASAKAREAVEKENLDNIKTTAENAVDVAIESEQQRQINLARLRQQGLISEEQYQSSLKGSSTQRIQDELKAEEAKFAKLDAKIKAGAFTTVETEKAAAEELKASRSNINELTLSLIESEIEAQERAKEMAVEAIKSRAAAAENSAQREVLSIQQVATALEAVNSAYDQQNQLLSARGNLLNSIGSALSDSFDNGIKLLDQDIANADSEKERTRLTKERDALEKQAAAARRVSLERSQALDLLTFDLRQRQLEIELAIEQSRVRGAITENQGAQSRARANIETLRAEGAPQEQIDAAQLNEQATQQEGAALGEQLTASIERGFLQQQIGGIDRQAIVSSQRAALNSFDTQELDRRFQELDEREQNARSGRERRQIDQERDQLEGQNNQLQRRNNQDIQFLGRTEGAAFSEAIAGLSSFADRIEATGLVGGSSNAALNPLAALPSLTPPQSGITQSLPLTAPAVAAADRPGVVSVAGGLNITNDIRIDASGGDTSQVATNVEAAVLLGLSKVTARASALMLR